MIAAAVLHCSKAGACSGRPITSCEWLAWAAMVQALIPGNTTHCFRMTYSWWSGAAGKRAKLWTTFNEPGVAALCGHVVGNHPPGKLLHFRVGITACMCSDPVSEK